MIYTIVDDNGWEFNIEADNLDEARELAENEIEAGDYGCAEDKTVFVSYNIYKDSHLEDSFTVSIYPEEPDCIEGRIRHRWESPQWLGGCDENPGVWGHGGGVIITEVCRHCGCKKMTDTWAQNPTTGEQGLESISYEPDAFSDDELSEMF